MGAASSPCPSRDALQAENVRLRGEVARLTAELRARDPATRALDLLAEATGGAAFTCAEAWERMEAQEAQAALEGTAAPLRASLAAVGVESTLGLRSWLVRLAGGGSVTQSGSERGRKLWRVL
jgi:hypothetical protein